MSKQELDRVFVKDWSFELKWALIFTVIGLIWTYVEKLMGWHGEKIADHAVNTNFFAVIAIALYVLALLDKRRQSGGAMTWRQGFVSGLVISVLIALLSPLAQWLTHRVISPSYFANAIRHAVESGAMTPTDAEGFFNLNNYMLVSAVFALLVGAATSAIVAVFIRRSPT
jgi:hypothetical protein